MNQILKDLLGADDLSGLVGLGFFIFVVCGGGMILGKYENNNPYIIGYALGLFTLGLFRLVWLKKTKEVI